MSSKVQSSNCTACTSWYCCRPSGLHRGNPPLPGVVDARVHDEQLIRLLYAQDFVIDQHLHRLPPASVIDVEAEIMEPNLPVSPHQACHLTEPEDAAEAAGVHGAPFGIPEHHLRCEIVDPALRIPACMRPVPPELVIVHELGMLPIDHRPFGAADDIGIQHSALDGEAAFRQVLPGMPLGDRRPLNRERLKTRLQRHEHGPMITDDRLGGAPLLNGLAEDLDHPGEGLPVEAPGPDNGAAVAVEDEDAIEPLAIDLDQVAQVGKPDLMGSRGVPGAFVGVREACRPRERGMGLLIEGHQLPDGRVAMAISQASKAIFTR